MEKDYTPPIGEVKDSSEQVYASLAEGLFHVSREDLSIARSLAGESDLMLGTVLVQRGVLNLRQDEFLSSVVDGLLAASSRIDGELGADDSNDSLLDSSIVLSSLSSEDDSRLITADAELILPGWGRYRFIAEQGSGGIGRILIVWDRALQREVAMKELRNDAAEFASLPTRDGPPGRPSARFLREARITSRLEHPSIVPVHEIGRKDDGSLYYTMKLVRGRTLQDAIASAKTIQDRLALLPHYIDLCQAIAYAHSKGVIHRDIKPSNVMLGEFGETMVIDWGLAKFRNESQDTPNESSVDSHIVEDGCSLTIEGQVVGTPHYMAPEQARGVRELVDERSDVYALGAVLYQLLSGNPPFAECDRATVLQRVVHDSPCPLEEQAPDVPPVLTAICRRAMCRNPDDRYASACELAEEIERYQIGARVAAYEYSVFDHLKRKIAAHRPVVLTMAVALLAILILTGDFLVRLRTSRDAERASHALAERRLYHASIALAQRYLDKSNIARARQVLAECPPAHRNWEWGRLQHLIQAGHIDLPGHNGRTWTAVFWRDGRRVISGGEDDRVIVWDYETQEALHTLEGHSQDVTSIAVHPNLPQFLSTGEDHQILLWDIDTGELLRKYEGHSDIVNSVHYAPDGSAFVTGSDDTTARFWDAQSGEVLRTFVHEKARVNFVRIDDTGRRMASAGDDGTIILWDVETGEQLLEIEAHDTLHSGRAGVLSLAFRPGQNQLASSGCDDTVKLWDLVDGKQKHAWDDFGHKVWQAAFSPDGSKLASASQDGTLTLWDPDTGKAIESYMGGVGLAEFSPDGRMLVTENGNAGLRIYEIEHPDRRRYLYGHTDTINAIAFSPDARLLASAAGHWRNQNDHRAIIWDLASGQPIRHLTGHEGAVNDVAFDPTRPEVATVGSDRTLIIWDLESGDRLARLRTQWHASHISSVVYSVDGKYILTGGWDGEHSIAIVWDREKEEPIHGLQGHGDHIEDIAVSPDGRLVATASRDGYAHMWSTADGSLIHELAGQGWAKAVAFSPDSKSLATAYESAIKVWDVTNGSVLYSLSGHHGRIKKLAYSPDGRRLVSCDAKAIKLWDLGSGEELLSFPASSTVVAFSPDGWHLATSGHENAIALWPSEPWQGELAESVEARSSHPAVKTFDRYPSGASMRLTTAAFFEFQAD